MRKLSVAFIFFMCLLLLGGRGPINISGSGKFVSIGGGVSWSDSFTRENNTDITLNCVSEGPNGDCGWIEVTGDTSITSDALLGPSARFQIVSDTSTDTLSQYSAAKFTLDTNQGHAGPILRATGGSGLADCFYTLRYTSDSDFELRACANGIDCSDIATVTTVELGGSAMADGDSIGIAVDTATGNGITFSLWQWDAQSPPARGSWGTPDETICTAGCDSGFDTATPTAALSSAGCTADADGVANKRVGIYDGNGTTAASADDWMGGDN